MVYLDVELDVGDGGVAGGGCVEGAEGVLPDVPAQPRVRRRQRVHPLAAVADHREPAARRRGAPRLGNRHQARGHHHVQGGHIGDARGFKQGHYLCWRETVTVLPSFFYTYRR